MFNGIYELLFGAPAAEDDVPKENEGAPLAGKSADGWFVVDRLENEKREERKPKEQISPRGPSEEELKRAAEKARVLAEKKRIQEIESLLFEEEPAVEENHKAEPSLMKERVSTKLTQMKVKRSKKSGKLNSNRSNDRKCNNIN